MRSATVCARIMLNPHLPIKQRAAAASVIYASYGEQGRQIVLNWIEAERLSSESSTWSQIRHHFWSSWCEGPLAPKIIGGALIVIGGGGLVCAYFIGGCAAALGVGAEAEGMAAVGAAGQEGEAAAGIVKNTDRIESATGTAAYPIPDQLGSGLIGDVKNVAYQSFTSQVKGFLAYAQKMGIDFNLYIRGSTTLSGPLQAAADDPEVPLHVVRNLPG